MQQSKNLVYIYADESGNSGRNLFDERSPYFYQGAMVTLCNLEWLVSPILSKYTKKYNVERLHAHEIAKKHGINEVLEICNDFYEALQDREWKFHCTIIEKSYIPTIKLFDIFFDYYENQSVNPSWMKVGRNRHHIISYLHLLMSDGLGQKFWESLCSQNIKTATEVLSQLIVMSQKVVNNSIREAIQVSLDSAYKDVSRFTFFREKGKSNYKSHTPNMIGFDSLSQFVQDYCKENQSTVYNFIHDLSDEFKGQMRQSHKLFHKLRIDVDDESFINFENTKFDLGSFYLKSSNSNPMLQVTDLFLWVIQKLYPKNSENLRIEGSNFEKLMLKNLEWHLLSFNNSFKIAYQ